MKIQLINHACLLIECNEVRILTDPWIDGEIFDNGWSLVQDTKLPEPSEYDFVWISHEHPDHFRPNLFNGKKIPLDKVIIIHERENDTKLKNFFMNRKYVVREIPDKGIEINKVTICGGVSKSFDSWLSLSYNGETFLNLNDCILFSDITELTNIKDSLGKISSMAVQFSFANWTGNKNDRSIRKKAKLRTFQSLEKIFDILKPENIIPFASFSYFSHEENFYLNKNAIEIDELLEAFYNRNITVLKIGDTWESKNAKSSEIQTNSMKENALAIKFWKEKYIEIQSRPLTKTKTKSMFALFRQFKIMKSYLEENNDLNTLSQKLEKYGKNQSAIIYLSDHKKFIKYDIFSNISLVDSDYYDVKMSSESLFNLMKNKWGFGTLMINGKFQANYDTFSKFTIQTRLYYMNNIGKFFPKNITVSDIKDSNSLVSNLLED